MYISNYGGGIGERVILAQSPVSPRNAVGVYTRNAVTAASQASAADSAKVKERLNVYYERAKPSMENSRIIQENFTRVGQAKVELPSTFIGRNGEVHILDRAVGQYFPRIEQPFVVNDSSAELAPVNPNKIDIAA